MNQLERAVAWIRYAEALWWNPEEVLSPIRNSEHVTNILEILRSALASRKHDRVRSEIDRVRAKYITMSRFDAGVAQLLCALAALELEDITLAREMLYDSRDNLSRGDSHHYAVATWMLGFIYWLGETSHNRGIDAWQETINIFERLGWDASTSNRKMQWYRSTRDLIAEVLAYAIEHDELPAPEDFILNFRIPAGPLFVSDLDEEVHGVDSLESAVADPDSKPIPVENFFQLFVVYDEIPAGLPQMLSFIPSPRYPAHPDLEPDDYIEVTRVRVGGQEYRVKTLKRVDRQVNLVNDWQYYCLRVRGKSMNQAGIDDGDMIMLRYQGTADSGDVVAAVLIDEEDPEADRYATFKRYVKQGEQISLKAESDDPAFKNWERTFTQDELDNEEKLILYGVAVAVLKPL
jgi:hypothetical protein